MARKLLLATLVVFIVWTVLDFVIHGLLLQSAYEGSMQLWRPMPEMKTGLMYLVRLVAALVFVTIYVRLISPKNMKNGLYYGLLFGLGTGISMGYGTYSVQPIPYIMALTWFLGTLVEAILGGVLTALIVKEGRIDIAEQSK
ncbi:MAG: DUF2177 family protein [Calditrichaeota bacterium]|nr:MAG: DUF2177 family protein [Calditrichota bacterium]